MVSGGEISGRRSQREEIRWRSRVEKPTASRVNLGLNCRDGFRVGWVFGKGKLDKDVAVQTNHD